MREIGVRDLKASLSEVLRTVGRGEQVRITMRGRPIADLVPAGTTRGDERISALVAEGRIVPASRELPGSPPRLSKARESASAVVLGEREDAR